MAVAILKKFKQELMNQLQRLPVNDYQPGQIKWPRTLRVFFLSLGVIRNQFSKGTTGI